MPVVQNKLAVRKAEIAHIAESQNLCRELEKHLQQILEGDAFHGSSRSGQFLRYIVEETIAQHYEMLKERMIGIKLFERSPSYDTSEDSIVRVTASDVRRRLLQHYGKCGEHSRFRISLPSGSYIPEIEYEKQEAEGDSRDTSSSGDSAEIAETATRAEASATRRWKRYGAISVVLNVLLIGGMGGFALWDHLAHVEVRSRSVLPWSAFFSTSHRIVLIPSDPNFAEIQMLENTTTSVAHYASHNWSSQNSGPPLSDTEHFENRFLNGDKVAAVDLPIAVGIARLSEFNHRPLVVVGPRSLQFADLKTDDNFVFLGSPQSNPWTSLFAPQLDFRFAYDAQKHAEYILNARPRTSEQQRYEATDENSYAILALVQNPDQNGQVLLLAGLTSEATESAGRLAIDLPQVSEILRDCGIRENSHPQFELLMHLNWVAGYPHNIQVVACHELTLPPGHLRTTE